VAAWACRSVSSCRDGFRISIVVLVADAIFRSAVIVQGAPAWFHSVAQRASLL
jgi:hypothetical protein